MSKTHKIKWLLYHEPIDLFLRTAEAFRDEIKSLTDGRIDIEIYSTDEYAEKFSNGIKHEPMSLINSGDVQMSQVQVNKIGQNNATDFYALELPFLFRSHDHATSVLEGPIGEKMLESLSSVTKVKGLAFTYSGGYRVIASRKKISCVDDFKGLTMSVSYNPIFADVANAFGCEHVKVDAEEENRIELNRTVDSVQTTLPRYQAETDATVHAHVVNTNHSMYLTTIIINNDFWDTLSIADQEAMRKAALNSSRQERAWSIEDANKLATDETEQARLGIKSMTALPEAEQNKLKERAKPVYEKYENIFSTGLVDSIRNA